MHYAGRDGDSGDGEADHLALTAAETADGIAHEEDLLEVLGAEAGAAEGLAGAVLASDGHSAGVRWNVQRGIAVRGAGAFGCVPPV